MQPGVKYSIVNRIDGTTIDGYIIDNVYHAPYGSADDKRGEIIDGLLLHRNPSSPEGGDRVLRVDGLTLIDEQGCVYDLVAQ